MTMKKITAGRDVLGEFAPKFAQLNDDVLFGEVWSRESELSARDRSLITVTALMSSFVAVNDFTGKNVVPFCTSLSSGIGQSGKLLAELADAGTWLDGQRFSHSSSEADIASWVNGLNL